MISTKKEFHSDPSTLYLAKSRIETLKRMADRYGRITVHDVQMIFGKLDGICAPFGAGTCKPHIK